MDPFTVATGSITIFGLAAKAATTIQHIKDTRKLPSEFASLLAEASKLDHTLQDCDKSLQQQSGGIDHVKDHDMYKHAKVAKDKLEELAHLLSTKTRPNGFGSAKGLHAFWTDMVHGKSRLSRSREELRDIQLTLSASLQVVSLPTIISLNGKIDTFVTTQSETNREILQHLSAISTQVQRPPVEQPPTYETSVTAQYTLQGLLQHLHIFTDTQSKMKERIPEGPVLPSNVLALRDLAIPQDATGRYCNPWCSCACHQSSTLRIPLGWHAALGSLSVSYKGMTRPLGECTQRQCRRRTSSSMKMSYRFPAALLQRKLMMSYSFSPLYGPESNVKLPRVVGWTSPIWQHATAGNVRALEGLFDAGLASPWDVSPVGGNLLHYATDHWSAEMCRMLKSKGVNAEAEDDFKSTAINIAWRRVLQGRMSADDASIIANLFREYDFLESRAFTVIHKTVLGLVSKDLDYELLCSTEHIDTPDADGMTPLSWASARGDSLAISILLNHGADPNIADMVGHSPLHYVQNTTCARLLLEHKADIGALNDEGQTPMYRACRDVWNAELVSYLLNAGSAVDQRDFGKQTALHAACGNGKTMPFVFVLLDAGADINIPNNGGDTPLVFSVVYNMHEVLRRMLKGSADFSIVNDYGQAFGHMIARMADAETVRILTDARPASLVPDLALCDRAGKTALDYFEERLALLEEAEARELRILFTDLVDALTNKQEDLANNASTMLRTIEKMDIVMHVTELVLAELAPDANVARSVPAEVHYD